MAASPCRVGARLRGSREQGTNILLWILQALATLLHGASGVMKVFLFDRTSHDVPSSGALPRRTWMRLGIIERVCATGLIVPAVFHRQPVLTVAAATVLATESLVSIRVRVKYRETAPIVMSGVLGLVMAFVACRRMFLAPVG